MAVTYDYPDFSREIPEIPRRSFLRDGYAEQRLRNAIQDVIAEYGGNRLIAQGIALEVVKDETEKWL
jgi:hypothetical protein